MSRVFRYKLALQSQSNHSILSQWKCPIHVPTQFDMTLAIHSAVLLVPEYRIKQMKRSNERDQHEDKKMLAASEARLDEDEKMQYEDMYEDDEEEEVMVDGDQDGDVEMDDDANEMQNQARHMYQPKVDGNAEEMEYESSAYILLHQLRVEWPCLSFDFIRDSLGSNRTKLPATAYLVAGTQADEVNKNKLCIMKLSEMHKTKRDKNEYDSSDSDDSDSDGDDDLDDDAVVDQKTVNHTGAVNRVRSMPQAPQIVASWSDNGSVYIWDITSPLCTLGALPGGPLTASAPTAPIFTFKGHKDEGYAMDFSQVKAGRMITGDCSKGIYLWQVEPSGKCTVDSNPFKGHKESVEDLQWSPNEETVFASCSVDMTVKIWDVRERTRAMVSIDKAHEADVNVISWNTKVPFLLASGSDDGSFKVWDLRMLKKAPGAVSEPVGYFKWHRGPVCSLQWHPHDETVIAVTGADNQVSVWDFGLEDDPEQAMAGPKLSSQVVGSDGNVIDVPPQLLFLHEGQLDPKELRFHPQIPGLIGSTAADGFHAFICEPLDPRGATNKYLS